MTQYWLVGANFDGYDMTDIFIQQGYWIMGWNDENNQMYTQRRDSMEPGDGVAIKAMLGQGAADIQIKAIGIVVGIGEREARVNSKGEVTGTRTPVYVDWKKTFGNQERLVPISNNMGTIHGPYDLTNDDRINDIFRLV